MNDTGAIVPTRTVRYGMDERTYLLVLLVRTQFGLQFLDVRFEAQVLKGLDDVVTVDGFLCGFLADIVGLGRDQVNKLCNVVVVVVDGVGGTAEEEEEEEEEESERASVERDRTEEK